MELWNEINLDIPLMTESRIPKNEINSEKLSSILQLLIEYLENKNDFHTEVAQLSRFIFMSCKQFRMMKGLKEMQKTHQALLRYLNLDLKSILESFNSFISYDDDFVIVPHRQSFDLILVRLQGLSKLLIRAVLTTRNAAKYFLGLIKAGSFYMKGVIMISTFASVWSHCRDFCEFIVENYNNLYKFRKKLREKSNSKWMDGNYELPKRLDQWLGEEYSNYIINQTFDKKLFTQNSEIDRILVDCKKENFIDNFFKKSKEEKMDLQIENNFEVVAVDDAMEIEDFTPISRIKVEENISSDIADMNNSLNLLKTKLGIQKFIKSETHLRKSDKTKSLTADKMSKKVWKTFTNDIQNKLILMSEDRVVDYLKDYLESHEIIIE